MSREPRERIAHVFCASKKTEQSVDAVRVVCTSVLGVTSVERLMLDGLGELAWVPARTTVHWLAVANLLGYASLAPADRVDGQTYYYFSPAARGEDSKYYESQYTDWLLTAARGSE